MLYVIPIVRRIVANGEEDECRGESGNALAVLQIQTTISDTRRGINFKNGAFHVDVWEWRDRAERFSAATNPAIAALLLGSRSSLGEKESLGNRRKIACGFFLSQLSNWMLWPSEAIA